MIVYKIVSQSGLYDWGPGTLTVFLLFVSCHKGRKKTLFYTQNKNVQHKRWCKKEKKGEADFKCLILLFISTFWVAYEKNKKTEWNLQQKKHLLKMKKYFLQYTNSTNYNIRPCIKFSLYTRL